MPASTATPVPPRIKRVVKRHPSDGWTVAEYVAGSSVGIYRGCFRSRAFALAAKRLMDNPPAGNL